MVNAADKILKRIRGRGKGSVHTAKDFLDLGSRAAVDQALVRLAKRGVIRRLKRGVYDYPKVNPRLGMLTPSPDAMAKSIARRTDSKLQISGAQAANALGLSTQVPARIVYLTDGHSKSFRVGNQVVELRHASPRNMSTAGRTSGTVFQALRYIGRNNVSDDVINKLKDVLSSRDKVNLLRDIDNAPDWIRPIVTNIVY